MSCDGASGPGCGAAPAVDGALCCRASLTEEALSLRLLAACDGALASLCCRELAACCFRLCAAEPAASCAAGGGPGGALCAALSAACFAEPKASLAADPAWSAPCGACAGNSAGRSAAALEVGAWPTALLAASPADCSAEGPAQTVHG